MLPPQLPPHPNVTSSNMSFTHVMSSNLTALEGHFVTTSYNPGYMILSFVIGYVGAWSTMELIHHRTSSKGRYNWLMLVGASILMGGIATWCMHFVGIRAIILGDGQSQIQVAYSPGFTVLSFFLPILLVMLAFWTAGPNETVSISRVCLGGTLAGLGFCISNYLGQAGISNYACFYIVGYFIASAAISILASVTALGVLLHFRATWRIFWWKRASSAAIFSIGIAAANWFSICGTEYQLKKVEKTITSNRTTSISTIIVISLSIVGCLACIGVQVLAHKRKKDARNRAQQVVLAAAIFDKDDRILVTPNGLLPTKKITQQFLERSFADVFTSSHPVFLWILRTSYYWPGIYNLVTPMRKHIESAGLKHQHFRSRSQTNLLAEDGEPVEEYAIIFRELYCIAAADLAKDLGRDLTQMGVLYEEIINTGHKPATSSRKKSLATLTSRGRRGQIDAERATIAPGGEVLGKGQLLFLISRVIGDDADALVTAGYRWASREAVLPFLASSLEISHSEIKSQLELMIDYIGDNHILEPGVHIAFFALRASIGSGFDILARKDSKNLLPTMQLPVDELEEAHVDYLKQFPLQTVAVTMKAFKMAAKPENRDEKIRSFAQAMVAAIEVLKEEIDDPIFNEAQLIVSPIEAPCRGNTVTCETRTALLIAYKLIFPIHVHAPGRKLQFVPLNLFQTEQRIYPNSPDHAKFARQSYRLFSRVLDLSEIDIENATVMDQTKGGFSLRKALFDKARSRSVRAEATDDSVTTPGAESNLLPGKFWGKGKKGREEGSQEQSLMEGQDGIPMKKLPATGSMMTGSVMSKSGRNKNVERDKNDEDKRTYVDEMFTIAVKTKGGARV